MTQFLKLISILFVVTLISCTETEIADLIVHNALIAGEIAVKYFKLI